MKPATSLRLISATWLMTVFMVNALGQQAPSRESQRQSALTFEKEGKITQAEAVWRSLEQPAESVQAAPERSSASSENFTGSTQMGREDCKSIWCQVAQRAVWASLVSTGLLPSPLNYPVHSKLTLPHVSADVSPHPMSIS